MSAGQIICFGELLLRLAAPGRELLMQSGRFDVEVGGAEANVAVALACLGHASALISIVPDNALGRGAVAAVRSRGVDCSRVSFGDGRMGLYFLSPGSGMRPSEVIYDRTASAFADAPADAFDWPSLLTGAARLHVSGITAALGPNAAQAAIDAVTFARSAGIPVSFDCNYRSKLWERWTSDPRATLSTLIAAADMLFGNHRDVSLLLDKPFDGNDPDGRRRAAEAAFGTFPGLRYIASTAREVQTSDRHALSARIDTPAQGHETDAVVVDGIVDRIGAGDAFAAGILHGLHCGQDLQGIAASGLALACLKHTLPGDASLFGRADIALFHSGARDVRR